jgi:prophage regulatory protein
MSYKILRLPAVQDKSGLGRSTLYARQQQGLWPRFVPLGARAVGQPEREVDALNAARIAGKSDEEIRALVKKLEADRRLAA